MQNFLLTLQCSIAYLERKLNSNRMQDDGRLYCHDILLSNTHINHVSYSGRSTKSSFSFQQVLLLSHIPLSVLPFQTSIAYCTTLIYSPLHFCHLLLQSTTFRITKQQLNSVTIYQSILFLAWFFTNLNSSLNDLMQHFQFWYYTFPCSRCK